MDIDSHRFNFFQSLDAMPADCLRLWQGPAAESFFLSRGWFDCLIATGLDAGDVVALGVLQSKDGRTLALLPARFTDSSSRLAAVRKLCSLTGIYACLFRPILDPEVDPRETARSLGRHLGAAIAASDIIQLDSVDGEWPQLLAFEAGLKEVGFSSAQYAHFGNWSELVVGRTFEQYLAAREGSIREVVRRRRRALEKQGASFEVCFELEAIDKGIAAYETVYARSWKQAEPYPKFHERLMRDAARDGVLRLGFCRLGERPIAVQLWIVWRGRATVLKLAHDQEFDRLSPGSVLLARMIRYVMEKDAAEVVDFGHGDDAYKRQWATERRQRIGLIAANPRSVAGFRILARHRVGRWMSALRD
jgi:hypothetical protein